MLNITTPVNAKDALLGAPVTITTEGELMRNLKLVAKGLGYLVFHNTYSMGSDKGFPDLTFAGYGLLLFLETKGPKWRASPEQEAWIEALQKVSKPSNGVVVASFAWPRDYEQICRLLETRYQSWLDTSYQTKEIPQDESASKSVR